MHRIYRLIGISIFLELAFLLQIRINNPQVAWE